LSDKFKGLAVISYKVVGWRKYMSHEDTVGVSDELANDPNYLAYQAALSTSQFESFTPGTYVAYHDGQLVGTGTDRDQLLSELHGKGIEGVFYHQVGVPEQVFHMRSPRIAR
jgi:hypothetical protein